MDLIEPSRKIVKLFAEHKTDEILKLEEIASETTEEKSEEKSRKFFNDTFNTLARDDEAVKKIFENKNYKKNTYENILFKMVLLDKLYSTRIENPVEFAKTLSNFFDSIEKRIDENRIGNNIDKSVVNEIANWCGKYPEKEINEYVQKKIKENGNKNIDGNYEYSFATKYCHFINDNYPIYDNIIGNLLNQYNSIDEFHFMDTEFSFDKTKKKDSIKDYHFFYKFYMAFQNKFGLQECSVKEIDVFLWTYGKYLAKSW